MADFFRRGQKLLKGSKGFCEGSLRVFAKKEKEEEFEKIKIPDHIDDLEIKREGGEIRIKMGEMEIFLPEEVRVGYYYFPKNGKLKKFPIIVEMDDDIMKKRNAIFSVRSSG